MLSKKTLSSLIIAFMLTLVFTACSAENIQIPLPEPTKLLPSPTVDNSVPVPHNCHRDGYQTYVAMDGKYCFAYPAGYYVTDESSRDNTTLQHSNPTPPTPSASEDIPQALQTSITIRYNKIYYKILDLNEPPETIISSLTIKDFAEADTNYTGDIIPWHVYNEEAWLRTEIRKLPQAEGENTAEDVLETKEALYIVYTKHKNLYYKIIFRSPSIITDQDASAKELEHIFFLMLDTFSFIDK